MIPSLLALALLAQAAPPSKPAERAPMKLAAPGFNYVDVDEKKGNFFVDFFGQELSQRGLAVVTKTEIATLVGFERQKQLLGCSETDSSCLAELAGALGVDGVIAGSIAKIGTGYAVSLKVLDPRNAASLAAYSGRVASDEALLDWLSSTAAQLAAKLTGKKAIPPAKVRAAPPPEAVSAPPAAEGKDNQLRLTVLLLEAEYTRMLTPRLGLGIAIGAPVGEMFSASYYQAFALRVDVVARYLLGGTSPAWTVSGQLGYGYGTHLYDQSGTFDGEGLEFGAGIEARWGVFVLGFDGRYIAAPTNAGLFLNPKLGVALAF